MRLKGKHPSGQPYTITLVEAAPEMVATPENHGALAAIHAVAPKRAAMVQDRLKTLIGYNSQFFDWIEKDPANGTLFANDPVAAIRKALPDLPADFFENWGEVPGAIKHL